jgi:hypothetical protein
MKRARTLPVTLGALAPLLGIACGSSNSAPPAPTCTNGMIAADPMNNYIFTSQITLDKVKVKPMSDLTFDWGGVNKDFLGHMVDPVKDLTSIFLLVVDLPVADFEAQLNIDTFSEMDVVDQPPPVFNPMNGETSGTLFGNFTAGGQAINLTNAGMFLDASMHTPANSTLALAAQTGTNLGYGIRMIQAFDLDTTSTNTMVTLTNTSTKLSYHADLHSVRPTGVPAGTAAMMLDWSSMMGKMTALGTPFDPTQITNVIVGHYNLSISQLESQFLDLETIATDLYQLDIGAGTVLDFTMLKDAQGNSFTGVTSDGTWLVGLRCGMCRNPAPWYLSVLVPVPQPCATM